MIRRPETCSGRFWRKAISISRSSAGSLNDFHQEMSGAFSVTTRESCGSLQLGLNFTSGGWYFGPTAHPASARPVIRPAALAQNFREIDLAGEDMVVCG